MTMDLGAHKQWILLAVGVLAGMTLVIAVVGVIVWARMRRKLRDLEAQAARPAGARAPAAARALARCCTGAAGAVDQRRCWRRRAIVATTVMPASISA